MCGGVHSGLHTVQCLFGPPKPLPEPPETACTHVDSALTGDDAWTEALHHDELGDREIGGADDPYIAAGQGLQMAESLDEQVDQSSCGPQAGQDADAVQGGEEVDNDQDTAWQPAPAPFVAIPVLPAEAERQLRILEYSQNSEPSGPPPCLYVFLQLAGTLASGDVSGRRLVDVRVDDMDADALLNTQSLKPIAKIAARLFRLAYVTHFSRLRRQVRAVAGPALPRNH